VISFVRKGIKINRRINKMTTNNELQSFEEEFFKRIRDHDAWKKLSAEWDFPWSDKIIERYADKWDWKELCENQAIWWSEELLEKYKTRIDWNALSNVTMRRSNRRSNSLAFDWNIIKKFESYWNWQLLSGSAEYIPVSDFDHLKRSALWSNLVDIDAQILRGKVLSEV
jgi:hypothetical protein